MNAGSRFWGCFVKRCDTALVSPADAGTNTGTTATLIAKAVDPLCRSTRTTFYLDRITTFNSPYLQTSSQVQAKGGQQPSWVSAALGNFTWSWMARTSAAIGAEIGVTGPYTGIWTFDQQGGAGIPRSLYLNVNEAVWAVVPGVGANARSLYLNVNESLWDTFVLARSLYLNVNECLQAIMVLARALYLLDAARDGEVFPWLNHLSPTEQYEGGQVDLYGDGFGGTLEAAAGATITVDSVNGGYIASNAVDRSNGSWVSNSNRANAWIRFTFGATKRIVAVALEGAGNGWGVPRFLFSSGSEINGGYGVPGGADMGAEYPCGSTRGLYVFPSYRDTTYVEIRGPAGDGTTFVGLYEVWILEEVQPQQNAETSRAWINLGLLIEQDMGIVSWQNRSPNFYPANSGVPPLPAATVTIPSGAVSGLVNVQEET